MNMMLRRAAVAALLAASVACGSAQPTAPTQSNAPSITPAPAAPAPAVIPPLSGPSRTFVFARELTYGVTNYTSHSRFVLYDDGAFALQYTSLGIEYHGAYTEANGVITFQWEGWSGMGSWGATGVLNGNSLTVQYNFVMQMNDFEDAVYALDPAPPR